MSGLLGVKDRKKVRESKRVCICGEFGSERGERVVKEEECRNGAPGTIIVAEKAPEILELGRVL